MKKFTTLTGLCMVFLLFLFHLPVHVNAQNPSARRVVATNGDTVPFLRYLPTTYSSSPSTRKYPLIIFLHGGGEVSTSTSLASGTPVWNLTGVGPMQMITSSTGHKMNFTWNGLTDTFMVIQPMSRRFEWRIEVVQAVIKYAFDSLKVDTNRIYLTGHSMGGGEGTFHYLNSSLANVKKLAAAAPVSPWNKQLTTGGTGGRSNVANANLPLWAFHAKNDSTGNGGYAYTTNSINGVNALNPAVKALMTIWDSGVITSNAHHHAPRRVYNVNTYPHGITADSSDGDINIYQWFLGQNKSLPPNVLPDANAGTNQSISTNPGTATLNGSLSSDAGGIVRYLWRQISGPKAISITNDYTNSTSAAEANKTKDISELTIAGTYRFELTVVDTRAGIAKDTIDVVASNIPVQQGNAVSIKTSLGRITTGDVVELKNATKFTLEAQFKYDSTVSTWTTIMRKSTASTPPLTNRIMLHVGPSNNSIYVMVGNGSNSYGYTAANAVSPGNWFHVAAVFDGAQPYNASRLKVYINGVQQALTFNDSIPTSTSSTNSAPFMAGGEPGCCYLNGTIDEVRVWNEALTAANINFWKNKLLGDCHPNIDNLVLYWPLDDTTNETTATPELGTAYTGNIITGDYVTSNQATDTTGCDQPPVVSAGSDVSITLPVDSIRIFGSATDPDGGAIASIKWEYVDGPTTYTIYPNPFAYHPIMKNLEEGVYRFRFSATDDEGVQVSDTMKLTVNGTAFRGALLTEKTPEMTDETELTLSIHPNPVRDMLNVTLNGSEKGRTIIAVYDAKGALQKVEHAKKTTMTFRKDVNISRLTPSTYYLRILINGKSRTTQFIKE